MKLRSILIAALFIMAMSLTACEETGDTSSQQSFDTTAPADTTEPADTDATSKPADDILPGDDDTGTSPADTTDTTDTATGQLPEDSLEAIAPVLGAMVSNTLTPEEIEALDNTKQGWGPGVQVDANNRPTGAIAMQERYGKYDAYYISLSASEANEEDKTIYLTFDEGYENGYTAAILDTLKEKRAQAVFFITMDYAKRNPELVRRMIDEGHVVGNHSTTHPSMPTISVSEAADEIAALHNYVHEEFGYTMWLFRPPMGEFSERTLALTQNIGYKSVFWSFAHVDWDVNNQPDPAQALQKITGSAHDGAIYLLHAVSKTNTDILGDVIDAWRAQGYTLKPFV